MTEGSGETRLSDQIEGALELALRDARWVVEDDADAEYVDLPKMASALLSLAEQLKEAMTALEEIARGNVERCEYTERRKGIARRILSRWEAP